MKSEKEPTGNFFVKSYVFFEIMKITLHHLHMTKEKPLNRETRLVALYLFQIRWVGLFEIILVTRRRGISPWIRLLSECLASNCRPGSIIPDD